MSKIPSAKSVIIQGVLRFLWAELKTLNQEKFRSLSKIVSGYIRMKLGKEEPKPAQVTAANGPGVDPASFV